jgi:hypothetical protein
MSALRREVRRLCLALLLAAAAAAPALAEDEFTSDFAIERCGFVNSGAQNPYFSLQPGRRLVLEGDDDGEAVRVEITVLGATKAIDFVAPSGKTMHVLTRVVEERESKDGELAEVSRNFFARCKQTNDVFYFGEEVDNYEDGQIVDHGGSWQAGVNGAQPGILVPARFLLGARYYQEQAPGIALDRAENVEMGLTLHLAGRRLRDCVAVAETSAIESGESAKAYCPGVGLVLDDDIELTSFGG